VDNFYNFTKSNLKMYIFVTFKWEKVISIINEDKISPILEDFKKFLRFR